MANPRKLQVGRRHFNPDVLRTIASVTRSVMKRKFHVTFWRAGGRVTSSLTLIVAAWEAENPWEEQPGIFKFRGIWQFVPQVRTPVISVYRNHNASDPKGKFKATHIPVLMRRDDESAPFRFNPKIAKEDLPPRWFIQGLFKFIPSRDSFGFSEDLEPPTKKIPYYKKPVKEVQSKDSGKGADNKSEKPSKKGTENKSEKPSGKKVEKPVKLNKEIE